MFLNLPERLQSEIADQALNFSVYGRDIFSSSATEQLSVKDLRMLLTPRKILYSQIPLAAPRSKISLFLQNNETRLYS